MFEEHLNKKIKYISTEGLQSKLNDKRLCGYHILYWMIYRLKHGKDKTEIMLVASKAKPFLEFCRCLEDEYKKFISGKKSECERCVKKVLKWSFE